MIDAIKCQITKKDFRSMGGSLENCRPIRGRLIKDVPTNGQPVVVQELYLPNPRGSHSLRVTVDEWGRITICGSLRKWMLGKSSLADLTKEQCHISVSEIAEHLHISTKNFMAICNLTHVELGYNIHVRHNCSEIIKRITKVGKIGGRKDYHAKHQTLYFNGSDVNVKIYDKCLEIPENIRNASLKEAVKEEMDRLANHGYHFIRVEIEMINSGSFKKYGLRGVKSFVDIFENWDRLHFLLVSVIARIKIRCPLIISPSMTPLERKLAMAIKAYGFEKGIRNYADEMCAANNLSRIRRLAYKMLEKYPSPRTFNLRVLRKEVARKLIRIHRYNEEKLLSDLFHVLWNTKHGRMLKRKRYIIRQE